MITCSFNLFLLGIKGPMVAKELITGLVNFKNNSLKVYRRVLFNYYQRGRVIRRCCIIFFYRISKLEFIFFCYTCSYHFLCSRQWTSILALNHWNLKFFK